MILWRARLWAQNLKAVEHVLSELLLGAKKAKASIAFADSDMKNELLIKISDNLREDAEIIIAANELDVAAARETLGDVMVDRLLLTRARIESIADAVAQVAALKDPVGMIEWGDTRPNGLEIQKVRVPFGVIAMIYESRPNVTADAAALCLKSGNVCVLRGGKEAINSNIAIAASMRRAAAQCGFDENIINLVQDTSRESANALMCAVGLVDLLIPRGGAGLINAVVQNAKVPVIETGIGICHVYVDKAADIEMAANIVFNAKTQRPSTCNTAEVCLVHKDIAAQFLPVMKQKLDAKQVELKLCERAMAIIDGTAAAAGDFDKEFLDYKLAVKVVNDIDEAISHISAHSSAHSDTIVSADEAACERFLKEVDSAAVYSNASTRFTDGGEFGFGCEIGISTQRLHARGPMGLYEMTTYKYLVRGSGQVR